MATEGLSRYGLFSIPLYFIISLGFIVKLSPLSMVFSRKSFQLNMVFFFVSYFIIMPLISTVHSIIVYS